MSANSFSPESKIELEVLKFLYKGIHEIKYMNIPDDIELTKKQHQQLKKYIDVIPLFYLNIIKYTKNLYEEIRLSKLNGKPQTIYIITKRTDPLFVRFFSKKYTEADAPYLFMGKKTDYNVRSDKDTYSKSHPYLFMDKTGTITDGKHELFEIFDENIEIDIIPSSSPDPPPETMTVSKPVIHHDVGTSPMTSVEPIVEPIVEPVVEAEFTQQHDKLKPVDIEVVHAIPIIPFVKPTQAIIISDKKQTRKETNKTIKKPSKKKSLKKKTLTKNMLTRKTLTKKRKSIGERQLQFYSTIPL